MDPWYKVELSKEAMLSASLRDEFAEVVKLNGVPKDAAMFDKVDSNPPYVCFFSPGCWRIAEPLLRRYGAVECPKPLAHQVILLVGEADSIKTFFDSR